MTVSTQKKSVATRAWARLAMNSFQDGPVRLGVGSRPSSRRIFHTVEAAMRCPRRHISPWIGHPQVSLLRQCMARPSETVDTDGFETMLGSDLSALIDLGVGFDSMAPSLANVLCGKGGSSLDGPKS